MKKKILVICIGLILVFVGEINAQMTKSQLQQMYVSYLREQGYQPSIDSDGDIAFKAEGQNFYILVDENDLEYFSILYPQFWEIESEAERRKVAEAASYATRTTKLVSVYMTSDNDTSIRACIFVSKPEDFKNHFARMINIIMIARGKFIDEMRK
jgi:hypothetical protein